jgi:Protein of unknown function (DUF3325)
VAAAEGAKVWRPVVERPEDADLRARQEPAYIMIHALAFVLAYAGFAALSLSMERHYGQVLRANRAPTVAITLRCLGWALILGAAAPCIAHWGWGVGIVYCLAIESAAALAFALLLPSRPEGRSSAARCRSQLPSSSSCSKRLGAVRRRRHTTLSFTSMLLRVALE